MIGYVAKDENGDLNLYSEEPIYDERMGFWVNKDEVELFEVKDTHIFDYLEHTDKPVKVNIIIEPI